MKRKRRKELLFYTPFFPAGLFCCLPENDVENFSSSIFFFVCQQFFSAQQKRYIHSGMTNFEFVNLNKLIFSSEDIDVSGEKKNPPKWQITQCPSTTVKYDSISNAPGFFWETHFLNIFPRLSPFSQILCTREESQRWKKVPFLPTNLVFFCLPRQPKRKSYKWAKNGLGDRDAYMRKRITFSKELFSEITMLIWIGIPSQRPLKWQRRLYPFFPSSFFFAWIITNWYQTGKKKQKFKVSGKPVFYYKKISP